MKNLLFKTVFVIVFSFCGQGIYAQVRINEIPRFIEESNSEVDSIVFYALKNLALAYSYVNLDSSQFYLKKLEDLTNKKYSNVPEKLAWLFEISGEVYREIGDIKKAKEHTRKSLRINLEIGAQKRIAYNYMQLGNHEADMYQYDSALIHLEKAKNIFSHNQNNHGLAVTISNIGAIHGYLGNESESIKASYEALDIYLAEKKFSHVAISLQNIGITFLGIGELKKAKDHILESIEYAQKENNQYRIAKSYGLLADIAIEQEKHDEAIELYEKDLAIRET
ncbi:MAG: tetratricopeptide repeat protein, partial [Bacteroidota bacterium]